MAERTVSDNGLTDGLFHLLRKWLVVTVIVMLPVICYSQKKKQEKDIKVLEWVGGTDYDFGKIQSGKIVSHVFVCINNGDSAVTLKGAEASCHCTVAAISREQIQKGEKGFVNVTFDPSHLSSRFYKTIFVFTDISKERIELHISGEVVKE